MIWRVSFDTSEGVIPVEAASPLQIHTPNSRYYILAAILFGRLPRTAPLPVSMMDQFLIDRVAKEWLPDEIEEPRRCPDDLAPDEDRRLYLRVI